MAKRWAFGFTIREWFLAPKDYDQLYEVGDSREVGVSFYMDSPDVEAAREKLIQDEAEHDIRVEILSMDYVQEIDDPDAPQKPIGNTGRSRHLLPRVRK